jgi:hypothetical protein
MSTHGWVKPGQLLGYAQQLKARNLWPPQQVRTSRPTGDHRPATGYILLPAKSGDQGARPIADTSWINSPSLRLMNTKTHQFEDNPRLGTSYRVVATVQNLGQAPVLGGFAEFYAGDPIWIDNVKLHFNVGTPGPKPGWLGVSPFSLPIGATQMVQSQRAWTPQTDTDLNSALLVQAYDPVGDKLTAEWDSWSDRHVARRDLAPNFAGTWKGTEANDATHASLGQVAINVSPISLMKQKAAFKPDGSYPSGDFEASVTVQALPTIVGRNLHLLAVNNVQYLRGALSWSLFSTNSNDPHAVMCNFNLTQKPTGQLQLACSWGPNFSASTGRSHTTLSAA